MRNEDNTHLGSVAADADLSAGASVADSDAGEGGAGVGAGLLGVDDRLRQGGHVHARVGFAGDEELVLLVFREHSVERLDGGHVLGGGAVIVAVVVASVGVTESNAHGGLDVQHVHLQVPVVERDERRKTNTRDKKCSGRK